MIKRVGYFLVLLSFLFNASCKDIQTTNAEGPQEVEKKLKTENNSTKEDSKSILCFGNSLTAGYGLKDESDGWTFLLQKRIDSLGLNFKVVNAGLSGETTAEGLQRINWVLNQAVDIFILELGANDMLRGLDVAQTESNLEKIIEAVMKKNSNVQIILAGMLAPPNMGNDYEKSFNTIFPKLSKKYNVKRIPFFLENVAQIPELNLPDGKHPNPKGQKIVLENVWTHLEPLLK